MNLLKYLTIGLALTVTVPLWAQTDQGDDSQPAIAKRKAAAPDSLSTRLGGMDTLGVMPTELETPYQGGTRRVQIDRTVFRREVPVQYSADSRRDAFRALITDEKREGEIQTDLLVVDGANLTGVVWAAGKYLAMVKDKQARTFFLREGDPVYSGRVVSVTQTHIVIDVSSFGDYRQVTLKVND